MKNGVEIIFDNEKLVYNIKLLMRDNYESVGFIPLTRIEQQQERGLILHQYSNGEWLGYIVIGNIKPNKVTHVWQECIDKSARGYGSGRELFYKLLKRCIEGNARGIRLRCAEDLESNLFWKSLGFKLIETLEVNNKRNRKINVYYYSLGIDLDV